MWLHSSTVATGNTVVGDGTSTVAIRMPVAVINMTVTMETDSSGMLLIMKGISRLGVMTVTNHWPPVEILAVPPIHSGESHPSLGCRVGEGTHVLPVDRRVGRGAGVRF